MATISSQLKLNDGMSGVLSKISHALTITLNSFEQIQRVSGNAINLTNIAEARSELIGANVAIEEMTGSLQKASQGQSNFNNSIGSGSSAANGLLNKFKNIAATVGAGLGLKGVISLADKMTSTTARLNLIVDDGGSVAALEQKIMASANRSRASYTDTAQTVSKLGLLAGDAFKGNDEIIKFAELMNKNFVIAGASASEQSNAMYQLTQAMAAGRLQGDEFRSITENAPLLATAIEDYMTQSGVSGTLKQWSADGLLTADVIKNALFASTDEIEGKFGSIPMTWAQVWTTCQNVLLSAFGPIIQTIGAGAQWVSDNWSTLAPIFWGLAGAVGAYAIALGIQTAATWLATGAARAFFATLLANPLTWLALGIGFIVVGIYKWIQSVGGLKIAWLITCNRILIAWDWLKTAFLTGVYFVMNLWDALGLGIATVGIGIQNYMGDMRAGVLSILQSMVNGAIKLINDFITVLNKIPGVSLNLVENVTFGTTAKLQNEAEKTARNAGLANYKQNIEAGIAGRDASIATMKSEAQAAAASRSAEIAMAQAQAKEDSDRQSATDPSAQNLAAIADNTGSIAQSAGASADAQRVSQEDLKYMRDIAEQEAINRFTTAEVKIDMAGMTNRIDSAMDLDGVISRLTDGFADALSVAAEGVHA